MPNITVQVNAVEAALCGSTAAVQRAFSLGTDGAALALVVTSATVSTVELKIDTTVAACGEARRTNQLALAFHTLFVAGAGGPTITAVLLAVFDIKAGVVAAFKLGRTVERTFAIYTDLALLAGRVARTTVSHVAGHGDTLCAAALLSLGALLGAASLHAVEARLAGVATVSAVLAVRLGVGALASTVAQRAGAREGALAQRTDLAYTTNVVTLPTMFLILLDVNTFPTTDHRTRRTGWRARTVDAGQTVPARVVALSTVKRVVLGVDTRQITILLPIRTTLFAFAPVP